MKIYRIARTIDWSDVDWSKGAAQIAREKETDMSTVWMARKKYAPGILFVNKNYADLKIDWSKSNEQIFLENHIPISRIRRLRKRFAPETVDEYFGKYTDWTNIDWSKSTVELSIELGISSQSVSRARAKYAPETLSHRPNRKFDWNGINWNKSNREIAYELIFKLIDQEKISEEEFEGLTETYLFGLEKAVSDRRSRYAPETRTKNTNWKNINWNKSNKQLALENGLTHAYIWEMRKKYAPETMPSYQNTDPIKEVAKTSNFNWYKMAKNETHDKMKIYRKANLGWFGELGEKPPEFDETEAIRLKDGRIFYMDGMNHWPLIHRLKGIGIDRDQFDAIGWLDTDGIFKSKATGKSEIDLYFKSTRW